VSALGEQTWFRVGDRSLEGWVHRPDGGLAVGAVVIAGPFAHEALVTYRALRVLAVEAARRGFVVVRFSWSGTGDSEPAPMDVDRSTAWQADLAGAVDLARAASGLEEVDAVGVRFGASVVSAADIPLRKRVLWGPLGGRTFLRRQSSLLKMHLPDGFPLAAHGVELCGYLLDDESAASLRALPDPRTSTPRHSSDGSQVVFDDDPEASAELFDREPPEARVPLPSIEKVLDALPPVASVKLPEWQPERELISFEPTGRTRVRQTLLNVGPDRLPGIFTEAVDIPQATASALFVPFANDPKGVARIGRATSFRLASLGVPTLRADRRGVGDAANPGDLAEVATFTETGADDVAQLATWLAERTGNPIVGIGSCSGAWLVARASTAVPFQRLVMVNNLKWTTSIRPQADDAGDDGRASRPAASRKGKLFRRLRHSVRLGAPYVIRYRLFSQFGPDQIVETLLRAVPEKTSVTLLFGTGGDQRNWESARGPTSVRRLIRRGRRIRVVYDPRTDHALMSQAAFESYLELLDREFAES
jgi:hypothetical protein